MYKTNFVQDFFNSALFSNDMTSSFAKIYLKKDKNIDNSYWFEYEIPGVKKQDVSVEIKQNILTIKAKNKRNDPNWQLHQDIALPKILDMSTLEAELSDGILKISIKEKKPTEQEGQSKKILVK